MWNIINLSYFIFLFFPSKWVSILELFDVDQKTAIILWQGFNERLSL